MPARKKNPAQIISLDAFGSAKNYWLCWVRATMPPLAFCDTIQKELKHPCAYIGSILLQDIHPDLKFPMFSLSFSQEYDVDMVILANHVTAPMELSLDQQNPLLGGLLFEDEYYLFNKEGLAKIPFSHPSTDYILLLSADKDTDINDYVTLLEQCPAFETLLGGTPQSIAPTQKKGKAFLDFLQYLFYESEVAMKEYRRRKLFRKLNHRMSVAEVNYERLRFPVEDNRTLTSALLRREDV